MEESQSFKSGR